MDKIFLTLLMLSTFGLKAEFLDPSQFDQPEGGNQNQRTLEQRQLEAQHATYRSFQSDERQYDQDIQMPAPDAGSGYLLQNHPQQEDSLQELPDR